MYFNYGKTQIHIILFCMETISFIVLDLILSKILYKNELKRRVIDDIKRFWTQHHSHTSLGLYMSLARHANGCKFFSPSYLFQSSQPNLLGRSICLDLREESHLLIFTYSLFIFSLILNLCRLVMFMQKSDENKVTKIRLIFF